MSHWARTFTLVGDAGEASGASGRQHILEYFPANATAASV